MPTTVIDGVRLYWESVGEGPAVVLVHGSWGDHRSWDAAASYLSAANRVVTYDRRGHSQSDCPAGQGSVEEDVGDLAGLIAELDLAPAHVAGSSFGGTIALRFAISHPDLVATLSVHEPPLVAMIGDDPTVIEAKQRIAEVGALLRAGSVETGARHFVDAVAFGPGRWDRLPPEIRRTFVTNAPTFLDELNDPETFRIDLARLSTFNRPTLLTGGDQSPPLFELVLDKLSGLLPRASRHTFVGTGHVPHLTDPGEYARVISGFLRTAPADVLTPDSRSAR